jgi:formamidopyrimidine-DNA glycosylase
LDLEGLGQLGPEPLTDAFTLDGFAAALAGSRQAIKVKLLDQTVVAGIGNIYASEALFRAGIHPAIPAGRIPLRALARLMESVREVLSEAIEFGSTLPLDLNRDGSEKALFYYGQASGARNSYEERLRVYGRNGLPCWRCRAEIRQIVQGARSTFWCPQCQRR